MEVLHVFQIKTSKETCVFYLSKKVKCKAIPITGPEGSGWLLDTRHMKVVRSSPLRTGRLYPQAYPGTHF